MRPADLIWALAILWQPIVDDDLMASPGATTCGELADKYRLNPELTDAAMVLWAEEFIRNTSEELRPETRRDLVIDSKEQAHRLRAYCDVHPLASFDQAVRSIYLNLQP